MDEQAKVLRRTWAEIHLERLMKNVQRIRRDLHAGCRIMGIVKADAYGHGAVPVAKALCRAGVEQLGVSNLEEAIQLRRAGIDVPILVISYTPPEEAVRLARYGVTQTVVSSEHALALSEAAVAAGVELTVHIKLDTGMSRVGFLCQEETMVRPIADEIAAVCRLPALQAEGIFTHFAAADEPDDAFTKRQFTLFMQVIDTLAQAGVTFSLRHCCISAATLRFPQMHLDMVRPGIILYGLQPDGWMGDSYPGYLPVLELKTTVSMVKDLQASVPVSYNRTYYTPAPKRVAVVPVGYADGYARALSNRGEMLIDGRRVPVTGRVCMDQTILDVTALPAVREGTVVTVFGRDGEAVLPVDQLAAWSDTIPYEVVCGINKRVPRVYFENGEPVEQLNYILP